MATDRAHLDRRRLAVECGELALELTGSEADIDGAIRDVNLGGESVFPRPSFNDRDVPIVLATGYDASAIPARYAHVPRREKPVTTPQVATAIGRVLHA